MAQYLIEHSFLFTAEERENIYRSSSAVDTRPSSLVTRAFIPIWSFISKTILAPTVAPNAITLVGLMSTLQAYQIIHTYYSVPVLGIYASVANESNSVETSLRALGVRGAGQPLEAKPQYNMGSLRDGDMTPPPIHYVDFFDASRTVQTATVLAGVLLAFAIGCQSVDGVHAKRNRSATSLGDVFSRVCASFSRIFIALSLLEVFQFHDVQTQWYVLVTLQLIEFNTILGRINANNIKKDKVKNWAYIATYFFRESELSFVMLLLLITRWFFPNIANSLLRRVSPSEARLGYTLLVIMTFVNIALLKMKKRYKSSIAACLAARVVPIFYLLPLSQYNTLSVVSDAMVVALLSIEVYVSDLAKRRIHAAVVFISLGSLLNDVFALMSSALYVIGVLVDLSYSLNVPLFVPVCNVFIDGVFDLCHAGHKRLMANALKFGNRLIVGVCGDEECVNYKRRPVMTTAERVEEVRLCKYVSEVIPNAPVSGITEEMVRKYNVHVVVCGEEYNTPTDTYYAVPRRLGILRTAPRTEGISTSELIKRIRAATDDDVSAKDKASGKSTVKE